MNAPRGIGPTLDQVLDTFAYHQPSADQVARITTVREAHKTLARAVWDAVPEGADRTAAIRKLHECMMTCNKAIVCERSPNP
jgi:hypothetical protein